MIRRQRDMKDVERTLYMCDRVQDVVKVQENTTK